MRAKAVATPQNFKAGKAERKEKIIIKQLKEINERFGDYYCDNIAPECFNLIIKSVILADKYTEKEKASIIKRFSDEVITVSDVLNEILKPASR